MAHQQQPEGLPQLPLREDASSSSDEDRTGDDTKGGVGAPVGCLLALQAKALAFRRDLERSLGMSDEPPEPTAAPPAQKRRRAAEVQAEGPARASTRNRAEQGGRRRRVRGRRRRARGER
jgi:hypothetical protein